MQCLSASSNTRKSAEIALSYIPTRMNSVSFRESWGIGCLIRDLKYYRPKHKTGIRYLWKENDEWDVDVSETNWMKMYERLKEYHSAYGNCRVPLDYDNGCTHLPTKLGN